VSFVLLFVLFQERSAAQPFSIGVSSSSLRSALFAPVVGVRFFSFQASRLLVNLTGGGVPVGLSLLFSVGFVFSWLAASC
jgi:hypothetical protein